MTNDIQRAWIYNAVAYGNATARIERDPSGGIIRVTPITVQRVDIAGVLSRGSVRIRQQPAEPHSPDLSTINWQSEGF